MSQKSFLDNKKITEDFPYVGGGGRPTYGKFHMFRRFYFWKLPLAKRDEVSLNEWQNFLKTVLYVKLEQKPKER